MPDDLRTRIAAIQAQHHHWDYAGALTCACGKDFGLFDAGWEAAVQQWAQHVADAVIGALHMREEISYGTTYPNFPVEDRRLIRYVTSWEPAE